jgi:hypothetical protein
MGYGEARQGAGGVSGEGATCHPRLVTYGCSPRLITTAHQTRRPGGHVEQTWRQHLEVYMDEEDTHEEGKATKRSHTLGASTWHVIHNIHKVVELLPLGQFGQ